MTLYTIGRLLHFLAMPLWISLFFSIGMRMRIAQENPALAEATAKGLARARMLLHVSMTLALVGGILMIVDNRGLMKQGWLHAKFTLLFIMMGVSGALASRSRKPDAMSRSALPMHIIMGTAFILVVVLAVLRPF